MTIDEEGNEKIKFRLCYKLLHDGYTNSNRIVCYIYIIPKVYLHINNR